MFSLFSPRSNKKKNPTKSESGGGASLAPHLLFIALVHQQQSIDLLSAECIETLLRFSHVTSSCHTQA